MANLNTNTIAANGTIVKIESIDLMSKGWGEKKMRVKHSKGYRDFFGQAISANERVLRANPVEVASRKKPVTLEELIAAAEIAETKRTAKIAAERDFESRESEYTRYGNGMGEHKQSIVREMTR